MHFRHSTATKKPTKLEAQWEDGIWLGLTDESDEVFVGTKDGVYKTRATKRKQLAERWGAEQLKRMIGTPWRMREREEQPRRQITIQPRHSVEVEVPRPRTEEWIPKRTYLRKHVEFAKYGFTDECPGCESAQTGTKNRTHSEDCRKRVEERMGEDRDHKRRLIDTKKRKEKYYEANDKKRQKGAEGEEPEESSKAGNAEAKRGREEQSSEQVTSDGEGPEAKRAKEEGKTEDQDMEIEDGATKDINQMDFWEVYNAEADDSMAHGDDQPEDTTFWDDNSGKQLGAELVKEARAEEMHQSRSHGVYEKVPLGEATRSGA